MDPYQHFIVLGSRCLYFHYLKNIGGAVFCAYNCFHEFPPRSFGSIDAARGLPSNEKGGGIRVISLRRPKFLLSNLPTCGKNQSPWTSALFSPLFLRQASLRQARVSITIRGTPCSAGS